jgi:hypothetical protein
MAKALKVPPPDLTRITARSGGRFPLARVRAIILGEQERPAVGDERVLDYAPCPVLVMK